MSKLGAHMSIAGGVDQALEHGVSIGCETIQIFLKNNTRWRGKKLGVSEVKKFAALLQTTRIAPVFAHSSYLINLASTNLSFLRRSIFGLIDEIVRAERLGVPFIVMHPGSHLGAGERAGLKTIAHSLNEVFRETSGGKVRIALETTAGQGTNLGCRFEQLAEIFELVDQPERLAVCVDTCHIFAAGYDIRTPRGYSATMRELDQTVGHKQIVAFHLNDSKKPLGSRVDRHEHIGKGLLGLDAFRHLLHDPRWRNLPMVLETPKSDDLHEDVENLCVLRSLL
ncbi:MAG: deoxyribonuclease IV [Verrucomicrobiia bacterium]|jgi:deoxyribonuclease-4